MDKHDETFAERTQRALGSSRVVPLDHLPSQGPLDLLELRREVQARLRSSGGRPTDPSWVLTRTVRFKPEHWRELEELASTMSVYGKKVSPAQMAAILIERGLKAIRADRNGASE